MKFFTSRIFSPKTEHTANNVVSVFTGAQTKKLGDSLLEVANVVLNFYYDIWKWDSGPPLFYYGAFLVIKAKI
jgi:hypothetical protein